MKTTILFVPLLVVLIYLHDADCAKMTMDQIKTALKNLRKTCQSQSGAAKDILDNAAQNGVFPPDPKFQCYLKCIMSMSKAMRNDVIRPDVMKTQADMMLPDDLSERVKNTVDVCFPKVTSSESCEAAWQFIKCYYETDNTIYFIP